MGIPSINVGVDKGSAWLTLEKHHTRRWPQGGRIDKRDKINQIIIVEEIEGISKTRATQKRVGLGKSGLYTSHVLRSQFSSTSRRQSKVRNMQNGYANALSVKHVSKSCQQRKTVGDGSKEENRAEAQHMSKFMKMYKARVYELRTEQPSDHIHRPSPAPVSTPSVGYDILGSNPNPAVSASVLRNVSKSKFSRMSGFSRALKSRLNTCGYGSQHTISRSQQSMWESQNF